MHKRRYAAANDQKVISRIKQDKTKSEEKLINHIMQKPKKITTDTCKNMIFDTQHSANKNYHIKAKLQFTHTQLRALSDKYGTIPQMYKKNDKKRKYASCSAVEVKLLG